MTAPVSEATPPRVAFDRPTWIRLLVLCAAVLFEGMSLSGISIQLADIQRDLELPADRLQLVASAFLATYAGFLPAGGRFADRWGRRRMFRTGVAVFGAGSLAAALAQESLLLVVARAVQGLGAAATAPAAVALIVTAFPEGAARNRALGVFSAMGAAGFSLGVVLGGLLTAGTGWRGGFLLYVPLSLLVLVLARRLPADSGHAAPGERTGWAQPALLVAGLITTVYAVGRVGSGSIPAVAAVAAAGVSALVVFAIVQSRSRRPLLPPGLATDRRMLAASIGLGGGFAAVTGAMFLVATALQDERGWSALDTGLGFLPQGLAVAALSTAAAGLANGRPPARPLLAGLAVLALGQLLYVTAPTGAYLTGLLPAALLVGAGIALAYPAAALLASAAATARDQGAASGLLTTCQQAGSALGVAAVTALESSAAGSGLWGCFGCALVACAGCALLLRRGGPKV
ncbi:MFS transporter [Streptomyces fulvoviolaceus]|uniref:MFS transporter n=1 Tax=Streptomyces fulvoviolaceus TaxID=285535 RepID=UPI0021BF0474|nr:MFS transporter [Streptomyces fulvoviolaceus]MCT9081067.1 MFS transporter [Streptomyces fulvoviolaceus]